MIQTCRNHCAACGLHFASVEAFERHRKGSFEPPERHCVDPEDDLILYESVRGVCRIGNPPEASVCSVWRLRESPDRARHLHEPTAA